MRDALDEAVCPCWPRSCQGATGELPTCARLGVPPGSASSGKERRTVTFVCSKMRLTSAASSASSKSDSEEKNLTERLCAQGWLERLEGGRECLDSFCGK